MKQRSALMMNAAFDIFLAASTMCAAPSHVVITVPSGAPGGAGVPALLAEWRQTGLVADAWLLKCTDPKHQEIAALAVLQFPDQHSLDECSKRAHQR